MLENTMYSKLHIGKIEVYTLKKRLF